MNWKTIYISGRSDFRDEVRKKVEASHLAVMPGYLDNSFGRGTHDLYWLDEKENLRALKLAVGSKLIWKFRLRFYDNLEDFIQARNARRESNRLTMAA